MQRTDSAVRDFFLAPAGPGIRVCLFIGLLLLQLLLSLLKHFEFASSGAIHLGTAVLFAVPFMLALLFLFRARPDVPLILLISGGVLCLMAMQLRLCFIDRRTGDFEYYLNDWLSTLSGQSFGASMKMQVGEYHVLYQYILFLITRLPLPWLYSVKAVSFVGDAFLLGAALEIIKLSDPENKGNRALLVLLLPAVVLNGGMFAQCDSLYTACLVWGLVFLLDERPTRGLVCMALAVCFKLQALFLYPLLPLLWLGRKCRIRDLIPFCSTILLVQFPAVLGGKSPAELITIYTGQAGLYTRLNYGAPNLWALITSEGLDGYAYGTFGIALAVGCCLLVFGGAVRKMDRLNTVDWVGIAALIVLLVVFCLPRMHERYVYAGEVLICLYALCVPRAFPLALAVSLAALGALWMTAIPLWGCAMLMLMATACLFMMLFVEPGKSNGK